MADCLAKCLAPAAPTPQPEKEADTPSPAPSAVPAAAPPAAAEEPTPPAPAATPSKTQSLTAIGEDESDTGNAQGASETATIADIGGMTADSVLSTLGLVSSSDPQKTAACCNRVRVLCRDYASRQECEKFGAARVLVAAAKAQPKDKSVVLQSLAAIVNLCSGDSHGPRIGAVDAGAIATAAAAVADLGEHIEVGEMACLTVQNLCFGDDAAAIDRRKKAAAAGAIEAILTVMKAYPEIRETCVASLRLCVDRVNDSRAKAIQLGAPPDSVKPITKEPGGLLSFRGGLGTFRRKAKSDS